MEEWDCKVQIKIKVDASAAIGISMRRGLGKIRHLETNQLWIQEKVESGKMKVIKIPGELNVADHLTKYLTGPELKRAVNLTSCIFDTGEHSLALKV